MFTNVLLVDEINRATPRTQSALLEAMEEGQVSIEGETRPLPDPFLVLATQNPIELEGTFALPEAQLDRFLVRLTLGYPDAGRRAAGSRAGTGRRRTHSARSSRSSTDQALLAMRDTVREIIVADPVEEYIVGLVRATRERKEVRLGGSPRATVALYRAAQAHAFLDGRGFVLPDDVKAVATAVLSHRVILDLDYSLRGSTATESWHASSTPCRRRRWRPTGGGRPGATGSRGTAERAMIGLGAGIVLIIIGALLRLPGLIAVGVIVDLVWFLRTLWTRFGLRGVTYERSLGATRALVGEKITLELTVRNRKLLPLPWLEVEDFVSEDTRVAGRDSSRATSRASRSCARPGRWAGTSASRAGSRSLPSGAASTTSRRSGCASRTFSLRTRSIRKHIDKLRYRIVPRYVPVHAAAPISDCRARRASRAACSRTRRSSPACARISRATRCGASTGRRPRGCRRPVSRRYDPVLERDVVIALDIQTLAARSG